MLSHPLRGLDTPLVQPSLQIHAASGTLLSLSIMQLLFMSFTQTSWSLYSGSYSDPKQS